MSLEILLFIGLQLIFFIIFSIPGLIAFSKLKKIQIQALEPTTNNTPMLHRYMAYVAQRNASQIRTNRITIWIFLVLVIVVVVIVLTNILQNVGQPLFLTDQQNITFISFMDSFLAFILPIIFTPMLGFICGANCTLLLNTFLLDAPLIHHLQMSTLPVSEIRRQHLLKICQTILPQVVIIELCAFMLIATQQAILSIAIAFGLGIVQLIARLIFSERIANAITHPQLIEQTEWAHLQPRIEAWSRLANIKFKHIYVQCNGLGTNIHLRGIKPSLLIGDSLLRFTDWRQLDAMLCLEIAMVKKNIIRLTIIAAVIRIAAQVIAIAMAICMIALTIQQPSYALLFDLIAFAIIIASIIWRQRFNKKFHTIYLDVDCISAYFTGDPMALMVALTTLNAINGISAQQRSAAIPSSGERIRQLDQLARQPWPRAPYAHELVPAVIPVTFNQYQLSMPFSAQNEAAPVPSVPYVQLT